MKIRTVLLSLGLAVPAVLAAQPTVMDSRAQGYLERGLLMYEGHNYVGAIDQLTQASSIGLDGLAQETADYYIALSKFERAEAGSLDALIDFVEEYPESQYAVDAQMKIGNYHFYRGDWENAMLSYSLVRDGGLDADAAEDLEYRRAYCNLRLGETDKAGAIYRTLARTKRYGAATQFYKAYIDYANGDYKNALSKFGDIANTGSAGKELAYQSRYYVAQIQFHNKDYNNVIATGRQLLTDDYNDYFTAELNRIVGESYYHTGDNAMARQHLAKYLANPEGEPYRTAGYTMGVLDFKAGNYTDALEHLSLATDQDDVLSQSAFLYTGQCKLKLGDNTGATMAFEQAANMNCDPRVRETAFYNYAISRASGARTPFDKSIDIFEQFINDYPNSQYKDAVEGHLVDAYMSTTDYARALESINHIKTPGKKVLKAKQGVLYNLGVQALSNNKTQDAINYLKQSVALGSQDKTIYNESRLWLAEAQYRAGDYKNASKNQQEYVSQSGTKSGNYGIAQYNLGYSLYKQQKYDQAKTAFSNAVASKQLTKEMAADAYNRIGDTNYYLQNYTAAQQNYDLAMAEDKNAAQDYPMYQKGIMMALNQQYDEAVKQMDLMLKTYPKSSLAPQALFEKGNALAFAGKPDEALKTFDKVASDYPKSAEARKALLQKAIISKNNNNEEAAVKAYRDVIKTFPTSNEAQAAAEDLKLIYADRGQLAQFEEFLNGINGAPKLDISEIDRLNFEAAEKLAIADNPSISGIQKYLAENPDGAYADKAKYYIARYNYFKGNYKEALKDLDEALEAGNDASFAEDALSMRADILMRQGKYKDALKAYEDMETKAGNEDSRTIAQLGILRATKSLERWNDVIDIANNLTNRGGLNAAEEREVTMNRAIANAKLGNTNAAMSDFAKLAADPQSIQGAQAAYELANMQAAAGKNKEAEKTVNALIDAGTPHSYWLAKSFILLSDIYAKQGKTADARDYLQSLKNNYPGNEKDITDAIDSRLKKLKGKK